MADQGYAHMGYGVGKGDNKFMDAVKAGTDYKEAYEKKKGLDKSSKKDKSSKQCKKSLKKDAKNCNCGECTVCKKNKKNDDDSEEESD